MEKIRNRYVILIVLMVLTAALVNLLNYSSHYKSEEGIANIQQIPLKVGNWDGRDLNIEKVVYDILETKSIIHRTYTHNGPPVLLSVVYYPETKVDFHAPEACLGGRGITIDKSTKTLAFKANGEQTKLELNQLIWHKDDYEELVYYFYKSGDFVGNDYISLRIKLAMNKIINRPTSGSLIRVSTVLPPNNMEYASDTLRNFIEELYPYIEKAL
jgi:EpsI family protein